MAGRGRILSPLPGHGGYAQSGVLHHLKKSHLYHRSRPCKKEMSLSLGDGEPLRPAEQESLSEKTVNDESLRKNERVKLQLLFTSYV